MSPLRNVLLRNLSLGLACVAVSLIGIMGFLYWARLSSFTPTLDVLGEGPRLADLLPDMIVDPYANWVRPEGPLRVGLQAGHWKNGELPDELINLRERGGGTRGGGVYEWEVNLAIAQAATRQLEAHGIVVDILPATIPPDYWADAFIAIHADGSLDTGVSGFKVAAPWRDRTGKAQGFSQLMERIYASTTKLKIDPNITRNMTGYYAFNTRRYEHSIHPMTPAIILETGFLTNSSDQGLLIRRPEVSAQAITGAVLTFLGLLPTEG